MSVNAARTSACATVLVLASLASGQSLDTLVRNYHDEPSIRSHAAVLAYANAHPKDMNGALALLALGSGELDGKQYNEAIAHLKSAEKRLTTLADYPAYLEAAAQFELRNFKEVEKTLKPVWDNSPTSPLVVKAVVLEANALIRSGDPKRAIQLIEQRGAEIAPERAALLLAKAYEAAGDSSSAAAQYQRVYTEFPLTPEADDAQASLAKYPPPSAAARLTRCSRLNDRRDYARARQELLALLPALTGADADTARVLIGVTHYQQKQRAEAFSYLKALSVTAPEPAAERLFYLEESARRIDRIDEMDAAVAQLGQSFPSSKWRLQALVAAGNYYAIKNQPEQYEPLYRACFTDFASDPKAADCHWRIAWNEYMKDRSKGEFFTAHLKQFPTSSHASAALYFLGRIAESKNEPSMARAYYDRAHRDFPNEYYGVLSRDKLKTPAIAASLASQLGNSMLSTMTFQPPPPLDMRPSATTQARTARARLLGSAGLDDLADSEMRYGARHDGQPQIAAVELARLAVQRNAPDQGIRLIKHYAPGYLSYPFDTTTDALWRYAFPLPFWKSLTTYADQRGFDPYLLAALIRQESEFNPKVVSVANAYGLTQELPSTGRELSRRLKIRPFRPSMLFTPDVNLNLGTYYLRIMLDSLDGKWEAALASYNAGKSRVVRWMGWNEYREPAEFVESIPITETRNYVQSILRNADVYRRLYGPRPVAVASTIHGNAVSSQDTGPAGPHN